MATEVKLPVLGENIETGIIAGILVNPGDQIEKDSPLLELETDKAVVEVPSPEAGIVVSIDVQIGKTINVGDTIVHLQSALDTSTVIPPPDTNSSSLPAQPDSKEEFSERKDSSSTPMEPKELEDPEQAGRLTSEVSLNTSNKAPIPTTPAVRRLAREIGVDLETVKGTGSGGRILVEDVKATAKQQLQSNLDGVFPTNPKLPDFSQWGQTERIAMNSVRKLTANRLIATWQSIPSVTQQDKADITDLERLRKTYETKHRATNVKITITAILVKVIASALKVFPQFNTSVDMEQNQVIYKRYYNVGIAVDTERGLLVPVIRDTDRMNIVQISSSLSELSSKARSSKLTAGEMQGGSFTISNLGGIGGSHFSPIINSPEVAILGVSRASMEPLWQENGFVPRMKLPLSLTYDHRLIDGADGIRFLRWIVEALEQPLLLVMEG